MNLKQAFAITVLFTSVLTFAGHNKAKSDGGDLLPNTPEKCAEKIQKAFTDRDHIKVKKGSKDYKEGVPGFGPWPGYTRILNDCNNNKDRLEAFTACVLEVREGLQQSVPAHASKSATLDPDVGKGSELTQTQITQRISKAMVEADYSAVDRQYSFIENENALTGCNIARPTDADTRTADQFLADFKDCLVQISVRTKIQQGFVSSSCRMPNSKEFKECVLKSYRQDMDEAQKNDLVKNCHGV